MGYTPRSRLAGISMPWNERNRMSLRREFVLLARQPGANISALCRGVSISRKTG